MANKLKPCPFCGSECVNDTTPPPDMSDSQDPTYYWVCPDCVCCGPISQTIEGATDGWNNRVAIDPKYQARRKRNFEACLDIESTACLTVDNVRERIEREMLDNINAHNEELRGKHESVISRKR